MLSDYHAAESILAQALVVSLALDNLNSTRVKKLVPLNIFERLHRLYDRSFNTPAQHHTAHARLSAYLAFS